MPASILTKGIGTHDRRLVTWPWCQACATAFTGSGHLKHSSIRNRQVVLARVCQLVQPGNADPFLFVVLYVFLPLLSGEDITGYQALYEHPSRHMIERKRKGSAF